MASALAVRRLLWRENADELIRQEAAAREAEAARVAVPREVEPPAVGAAD